MFYVSFESDIRQARALSNALIQSMLLVSFYTPWKHQKPSGFHMFQGVQKRPAAWNELKTNASFV